MCALNLADHAVLAALIQPFQVQTSERGKSNLGGYCQAVTAAAEKILNERCFLGHSWQAVEGTFFESNGNETGHAWLQASNGYILDLTADQFGLVIPLFVSCPHAQYSCNAEDVGIGVRESAQSWFGVIHQSFASNGILHP